MMEEYLTIITIYTAAALSITTLMLEILKLLQDFGLKSLAVIIITFYIMSSALGLTYGVLVYAMPIIIADALALIFGITLFIRTIRGKVPATNEP
jgi:hypothetical protein